LVGHGMYSRQVRGLTETVWIDVWVQRFLCLICGHTMSLLPDWLLPYRWYAATAIIEALYRHCILRETAVSIGFRFGRPDDATEWKSLRRWQKQLLRSAIYDHCNEKRVQPLRSFTTFVKTLRPMAARATACEDQGIFMLGWIPFCIFEYIKVSGLFLLSIVLLLHSDRSLWSWNRQISALLSKSAPSPRIRSNHRRMTWPPASWSFWLHHRNH
jgi:hypothetical protein